MKALLGKINGERAVAGKAPIAIGIGIHTANAEESDDTSLGMLTENAAS